MPVVIWNPHAGVWQAIGQADVGGGSSTPPPSGDFPADQTQVGWRHAGLTVADLTPRSGTLTISTNGAVIDKIDQTGGSIVVNADNVTIKRGRLTSGSSPMIRNNGNNLLVQDFELAGLNSVGSAGVGYSNFHLDRVHIHGTEDGVKASQNTEVGYCLIRDLYRLSGTTHNDCIQISNGNAIHVHHNNLQNPYTSVSCLFIKADTGAISDVLAELNYMSGGGFTVYGGTSSTAFSPATNVRILNNLFGRDLWPNGGANGLKTNMPSDSLSKWLGNKWADTLEDIP